MKRLFAVFIVLAVILLPAGIVFAATPGYSIAAYDVGIKVSSENTYETKETITADFEIPKHGIYRSIPMRYEGQKTGISNIYVSEQYTQSKSNGELILKIGDPDITLTGLKKYVIAYEFDMGGDQNDGFDLFYFNIIGTGWDTFIENVKFEIELPVAVSTEDVSFYTGAAGNSYQATVHHVIEGTRITGFVPILGPNEGLTVRIVLPEDTFAVKSMKGKPVLFSSASWIICLLLMLFAWHIWNSKGRDPALYPSVQFEPPENMTPAEAGYVIDGIIDNKDITSLIFHWAEKGFIDISESGKNEFLFVRKKEPETSNDYETFMFHRLFEYGRDGWVSTNDLKQEFYEDIPLVKAQIMEKYEGGRSLFTKESKIWSRIVFLLSALPLFLLTLTLMEGLPPPELFFSTAFTAVVMLVVGGVMVHAMKKWNIYTRLARISRIVMFAIMTAVFFAVCFVFAFTIEEAFSPFYHSMAFIVAEALRTALATFTLLAFSAAIIKRTEFGHGLLEHLLGLRNFIKEAEMDKLKQMIDKDPEYFYSILPYAIVLGLENSWARKFEGITMPP
ncbi:MAG: DUF2207 domain-containing protein, partial [Clostridia bacterium]|nr:DUF2207 domain-containing protein [Clostridia bacterium]